MPAIVLPLLQFLPLRCCCPTARPFVLVRGYGCGLAGFLRLRFLYLAARARMVGLSG